MPVFVQLCVDELGLRVAVLGVVLGPLKGSSMYIYFKNYSRAYFRVLISSFFMPTVPV